ncbi:MAG: UDP-N-acetylglucosamine 2-epimerase, partial [Bacteroidales bacterium]|nr:UDP-N-acetylglucosamine 2-epimerase [Bacteroidales bacterium]
MYDVALYYNQFSGDRSTIISDLGLNEKPFLLTTLHRQENTDDLERLNSIISALNTLSFDYKIVLPIHPRTRKILENEKFKLNFEPIEPVGYFDMIELLKLCKMVVTDRGGVQKEAFFFGKHCLVTRDETEWTELVDLHYNFMVGAETDKIINTVAKLSESSEKFEAKPYGDGNAAEKIALILKDIN